MTSLDDFILAIPPGKIERYLLNPDHAKGRAKAEFFMKFGFSPHDPESLAEAIVAQARACLRIVSNPHPEGFGIVVSVAGPLPGLDGRSPRVRSIWQWIPQEVVTVEGRHMKIARLVTVVPSHRVIVDR